MVDNPVVKLDGLEIQLEALTVENAAAADLPFDPFGETLPAVDFRMDWRYLDLRRPENLLIFKVQTTAEAAMREYWLQHDFMEIHIAQDHGHTQRKRRGIVRGHLFRPQGLPGPVAAVLQANGHGSRL